MNELLERADEALAAHHWFEAERLFARALEEAQRSGDYERMIGCIEPLAEARRQRLRPALESHALTILTAPVPEEATIAAGCYLVQPPQVGADARRLRLMALKREVSVAVVCREPRTRGNECPIVAIGGGATVRTRIVPPDDWDRPDLAWFREAMDLLGEAAIESVDPGLDVQKRVELITARMDAVPDHDGLHLFLLETCREALQAAGGAGDGAPPRRRPRDKDDGP